MKRIVRPPRYLPEVVQAIYELKEHEGSNSTKIINHVKSTLINAKSQSNTPRNISAQIRRALKHAATNGILKQRAGKFRINTDNMFNPTKQCTECRRRKRQQENRRRRRRRRSYSLSPSSFSVPYDSDYGYSDTSFLPIYETRRHRRKTVKRRRRRQRRIPRVQSGYKSEPRRMEEELRKEIEYADDHKDGEEILSHQCNNPDCLCNAKGDEPTSS